MSSRASDSSPSPPLEALRQLAIVYPSVLPWRPHFLCPHHIIPFLEAAIADTPAKWLIEPQADEVFESADDCQRRLQGFALSVGFAVVRVSGSMKQQRPRFQFKCIHHGVETANKRGLEEHVERDTDGNIVSRRKQEGTSVQQRGCKWEVYLALKILDKGNSAVKALMLGITNNTHSHPAAVNPLGYKVHEKALESYY
jgi:hypothetical protein